MNNVVLKQTTPRNGNNNMEVLGKWAYEVVSDKVNPCHFDSGGLILLLRLRRSIVNICSISFRLLNCSRLLHGRAKVCMVVSSGAQTTNPCDKYRFVIQGQLGYQVNQCIQFAFKLLCFR